MVGDRYGRLVIFREFVSDGRKRAWVRCDCGSKKVVRLEALLRGRTKSCGCLQPQIASDYMTTHGGSKKSWYSSWANMVARCTRPSDPNYSRYGGAGVEVCDRWRVPANFLEDMGEPPDGTSLDRIDNTGGYEPGNCRWATPTQQARNTRRNRFVTYRGQLMVLSAACEAAGLKQETVRSRIDRWGWSDAEALEEVLRVKRTWK